MAKRCGASRARNYLAVRLVALDAPEASLVLAQWGVRTKEAQAQTAEDRAPAKQEAELRVAPRRLDQVRPLRDGRLVSGDARSCQQTRCRQLRAAGAHVLFAVKDHQPSVPDDIRLLFRAPPPGAVFLTAQTVDKHGGRQAAAPAPRHGLPVHVPAGGELVRRRLGGSGRSVGPLAAPSCPPATPRGALLRQQSARRPSAG
jgi:hypothetical protein